MILTTAQYIRIYVHIYSFGRVIIMINNVFFLDDFDNSIYIRIIYIYSFGRVMIRV